MGKPKERRILYENIDAPDMHTLDVYRRHGGYASLEKLFDLNAEQLLDIVRDSGLRGRGGAGVSAGFKWNLMGQGEPKYLIANADESEPGTFSNRYILQHKPHMLIEGMIIAAWSLGVHKAYVYVRGEFTLGKKRLDAAIQEAYEAGILGESVAGHDFALDIYTHAGAGAYICGEETGLIESLEGKRGQPRVKPPFFPAAIGVFMQPTMVHNVETLSNLPYIINNGTEWYQSLGAVYKDTPRGVDPMNTGTKLYCVSGHVEKPGVYEVEMGLTVRELVELAGGVRGGNEVKAVIPGGSSAPVLTPYELDVPVDFTCLQMAKTMLGSGGIIVMDETTCTVRALENLMDFYAHESCGQCTPCRVGTPWTRDIVARIEAGKGRPGDVDHLIEVANNVANIDTFTWNTICVFGIAVSWPAVSFARKFRPEFEAHIEQGKCVTLPVSEAVAPPEENYAWPQELPEVERKPTWDY
ncbi:MAG: NADH-quinone oxidoreductase subunit NuoF [Candidatus Poribacteria bacterium]|nr:NADH-quinone oxidoreductase subunit NuoF [Candidatus Poribacteria bacterium]